MAGLKFLTLVFGMGVAICFIGHIVFTVFSMLFKLVKKKAFQILFAVKNCVSTLINVHNLNLQNCYSIYDASMLI
jgi:hypothetical protein